MKMTPQQALDLRDKMVLMAQQHEMATVRRSSVSYIINEAIWNEVVLALFKILPQLKLILWEEEIYFSATNGAESFVGTPTPAYEIPEGQFWIVDNCALTDETKQFFELPETVMLVGFIVLHAPKSIDAWMVVAETESGDIPLYYRYMYSQLRTEPVCSIMARIVAGINFLNLPFVAQEDEVKGLPRHIRRAADLKRRSKLPEINTVSIRRPEGKPFTEDNQPEQDGKKRHLTYQFLVNAFWRKPNHRMKEQRPIYVRPHVRGPKDKEFKATRPIVYRANK